MVYFDASALAKRYVRENGSLKVRRLLSADVAATSRLTEVEIASALVRRAREGAFSEAARDRALAALAADMTALLVVELTADVAARARELLIRHPLRAGDIFIGVNALDYSGYPDCRPEFIEAFERLASLATARGVSGGALRVHAPLLRLTKAEIIAKGLQLGLDYSLTHSCYDPGPQGQPCGRCDSCIIRATGFAQAGVADPVLRR